MVVDYCSTSQVDWALGKAKLQAANYAQAASLANSCKIKMVAIATTLPFPFFSFQDLYDVLFSGRVRTKDHCNERHENGKRNSEDDANDERLFLPDANYQANQEKDHATSYD